VNAVAWSLTALTLFLEGKTRLYGYEKSLYLFPYVLFLHISRSWVLLFKEPLTRWKIGALLLALVGTALTVGPTGRGQGIGILLALTGAAISSVYILVGSRIMPKTNTLAASTTVIAAAGVVYAGIVAIRGPLFPQTPLGWGAVLAIVLVSTVIGIVTFFAGLQRIGPSRASTLSTFEPVVSVLLAILILGESIRPLQVVGGMLILVAVIVCSLI
jgi:drug/metabolite transporter (DMT)-like permease